MYYNQEEFDEILNIFKAESEEIIQKCGSRFMELECTPDNKTPLKELLQLAHSLKGAARMIEFTSIQDISHKLEDVLSYWNDDEVKIDTAAFPVLYKFCDYALELIDKSVKQKSDFKDERTEILMRELDKFLYTQPEQEHFYDIKSKAADVDAILLELVFVTEKNSEGVSFEEASEVLRENLEQLEEIFTLENYPEIYTQIKSLAAFLSETDNAENNTDIIKNKIYELENKIRDIFKNLNITPKEKNCRPESGNTREKQDETSLTPAGESYIFIIENLKKIKLDKSFASEIKNKLNDLKNQELDGRIAAVIDKLTAVFDKYEKGAGKFDSSCYTAVMHALFFIKNPDLKDKTAFESSYTSIMQGLSIAEDMLSSKHSEPAKSLPSAGSLNSLLKNGFPLSEGSINGISGFQEIKTLRVDTSKLDNLISRTNELLTGGIKTREHIISLAEINNKLIKWNAMSKKVLTYFKYLEKKGFFQASNDDGAFLFYKRTRHFFSDNAELINEINTDFTELYNTISEDDNKFRRTAAAIDTIAKGIRVLPLAALFHSFPRMVNDIARESGKKVNFIISGSDTAVDKKIIEEIKMPLIHILRNAVSHGIESPEERVKNGKNETGIIRLSSGQEENNVIITIEDDGSGVNIEKVKEKALEKGLLTREEIENTDTKQLLKILFLPGFSTEESVNEISGRGIGLDIVKTKITNLNGEIFIDSVLGRGCRVTIRLPLSMSAITVFIILAGGQKFAVPINTIKHAAKLRQEKIIERNGIKSVIYNNHAVPLYTLSDVLGIKSAEENSGGKTVIIIESRGKEAAFAADMLLGGQEVFQKKFMLPIVKIKNISGFTMLPAGEICLILNPYELVKNTMSVFKP